MNKFKIIFEDLSILETDDWNKVPDLLIKSLVFSYLGVQVYLENYLSYNCIIEKEKILIIGKTENRIEIIEYINNHIIKRIGKEEIITGQKNGLTFPDKKPRFITFRPR